MALIAGVFLVPRNKFAARVENFLIKPDSRLCGIHNLIVASKPTMPPGNIVPVVAPAIWQVEPLPELFFVLLSASHRPAAFTGLSAPGSGRG